MTSLLDPANYKWRQNCIWVRKNDIVDSRAWVDSTIDSTYSVKLWSTHNTLSNNTWKEVSVCETLEEAMRVAEVSVLMGLDTALWDYRAPTYVVKELGWYDDPEAD